jgi:hypothetical protein
MAESPPRQSFSLRRNTEVDDFRVSLMMGQRNQSQEYYRITLNSWNENEEKLNENEELQLEFEKLYAYFALATGLSVWEVFSASFSSTEIPLSLKIWSVILWIFSLAGIFLSIFVTIIFLLTSEKNMGNWSLIICFNIGTCIQQIIILLACYSWSTKLYWEIYYYQEERQTYHRLLLLYQSSFRKNFQKTIQTILLIPFLFFFLLSLVCGILLSIQYQTSLQILTCVLFVTTMYFPPTMMLTGLFLVLYSYYTSYYEEIIHFQQQLQELNLNNNNYYDCHNPRIIEVDIDVEEESKQQQNQQHQEEDELESNYHHTNQSIITTHHSNNSNSFQINNNNNNIIASINNNNNNNNQSIPNSSPTSSSSTLPPIITQEDYYQYYYHLSSLYDSIPITLTSPTPLTPLTHSQVPLTPARGDRQWIINTPHLPLNLLLLGVLWNTIMGITILCTYTSFYNDATLLMQLLLILLSINFYGRFTIVSWMIIEVIGQCNYYSTVRIIELVAMSRWADVISNNNNNSTVNYNNINNNNEPLNISTKQPFLPPPSPILPPIPSTSTSSTNNNNSRAWEREWHRLRLLSILSYYPLSVSLFALYKIDHYRPNHIQLRIQVMTLLGGFVIALIRALVVSSVGPIVK